MTPFGGGQPLVEDNLRWKMTLIQSEHGTAQLKTCSTTFLVQNVSLNFEFFNEPPIVSQGTIPAIHFLSTFTNLKHFIKHFPRPGHSRRANSGAAWEPS